MTNRKDGGADNDPIKMAIDALEHPAHWYIEGCASFIECEAKRVNALTALRQHRQDGGCSRERLLDLLEIMWDGYENGEPCYEMTNDPDDSGTYIGNAFRVDADIENEIVELLNNERPNLPPAPKKENDDD